MAAIALAACATTSQTAGTTPQPSRALASVHAPAPASLIGKGQGELVALLGSPSLVRREKGVEVWQYAGGTSCVMLLYLYSDGGSDRHVKYIEAMPQNLSGSPSPAVTSETCLAEQMRAKRSSG